MLKKYKELIITSLLIVLVIANVIFTVSVSANGAELTSLEKAQNNLLAKNQELTDKITNESSLSIISQKADSLGFSKPENIVYTNALEPVANLP